MSRTQVIDVSAGARTRRRAFIPGSTYLVLPALLAVAVFFIYPIASILWLSFSQPELGFDAYLRIMTDGVTPGVMLRTLVVGLIVGVATLVLGYPYAYTMTMVSPGTRAFMLTMVMVPFWLAVIARSFAWVVLLGRGGPIEQFFEFFGIEGVVLLHSWGGVAVAMVQVMLPFMVLPLYNAMTGIDRRLLTASSSLGANGFTTFTRIYLPLSIPGILAGFSLVFVVTLGFYVTPALLGSPDQALMAQIIATRVDRLLDFPAAGALGAVLLVVTLLVLWAVNRVTRISTSGVKGKAT